MRGCEVVVSARGLFFLWCKLELTASRPRVSLMTRGDFIDVVGGADRAEKAFVSGFGESRYGGWLRLSTGEIAVRYIGSDDGAVEVALQCAEITV